MFIKQVIIKAGVGGIMLKKFQLSCVLVLSTYILLALLSFVANGKFDIEFLGKWGLLSGFLLLIGTLPFFKTTYFGGRGLMGSQTPEIPPDEHLNNNIHQLNEKIIEKDKRYQDVLTLAGIVIIVLSLIML
ncbi:hypothetical protein [Lottiidibacillus patelloidae]|uniref:hypothetical protein n=1 Tax=Lottiidibacillus patelloidae TaxID=2670334 RepID=UPI001E472FB4|nr:hypothetical protein [Lottiidibacillus patelloidae]